MKNPPFDSLVWGSLRLAPIILMHSQSEGYTGPLFFSECISSGSIFIVSHIICKLITMIIYSA